MSSTWNGRVSSIDTIAPVGRASRLAADSAVSIYRHYSSDRASHRTNKRRARRFVTIESGPTQNDIVVREPTGDSRIR